jgi:hypothetical protein
VFFHQIFFFSTLADPCAPRFLLSYALPAQPPIRPRTRDQNQINRIVHLTPRVCKPRIRSFVPVRCRHSPFSVFVLASVQHEAGVEEVHVVALGMRERVVGDGVGVAFFFGVVRRGVCPAFVGSISARTWRDIEFCVGDLLKSPIQTTRPSPFPFSLLASSCSSSSSPAQVPHTPNLLRPTSPSTLAPLSISPAFSVSSSASIIRTQPFINSRMIQLARPRDFFPWSS